MPRQIVLASHNEGKVQELATLLRPLDIELLSQKQLGVAQAEEPHLTFIENALAKARHVAKATGLPALADDSGLCVSALQGEPGVHSARFAQMFHHGKIERDGMAKPAKQDEANIALLLEKLASHTDRRAHYTCTLVFIRHARDPEPLFAQAHWHGEIATAARGQGGFGYDPIFYLPEMGKTVSELAPDFKNARSHRAQAFSLLLDQLRYI
jgi:XTP/dITP diphosphohydrolase